MLNNSRDEEIKERLMPLGQDLESLDVPSTLQPNTKIQQSDDEEQDSQSDDERQEMIKNQFLSLLMKKNMIYDEQQSSQSDDEGQEMIK